MARFLVARLVPGGKRHPAFLEFDRRRRGGLVRYRPDLSHSELLQQVKGRSSKWINETFPRLGHFTWQEGYGGFTVSKSALPRVQEYITTQKQHHQRQDFKTEFLELLRRHGIEHDENEVFR